MCQKLDKLRRSVMQCIKECAAVTMYSLLLTVLWLKPESCQLVSLPATGIKLQATGSKGEPNVIIPEETYRKRVLHLFLGDSEAFRGHMQGLAPSTRHTGSCDRLTI